MRSICTLALIAALVSCGSLEVELAVLDPAVIESEVDRLLTRDLLPHVLASSGATMQSQLEQLREQHIAFYIDMEKRHTAAASAPGTTDKAKAANLLAAASYGDAFQNNEVVYQEYEAKLINALHDIQGTYKRIKRGIEAQDPLRMLLSAELRKYQETGKNLINFIESDTHRSLTKGASLSLSKETRTLVAKEVQKLGEASGRSVFGNAEGLKDSPYAYAAAAADESSWAKKYNHAYGGGDFGNVDVALILNKETGNFSVKGLSFDPSDVVAAIGKVATQAMLIAAQISGVPVTSLDDSDANASGASLVKGAKRLQEHAHKVKRDQERMSSYRNALTVIARAILREQAAIEAPTSTQNNTHRKAAIDAIKASFDAHSTNLTK